MMREERLERLLRLRRHQRDMAALALHRAQDDANLAQAAAAAARERRGEAERRMEVAQARPQSAQAFLQGRYVVLERLDEERLRDLQVRRTGRAVAMRRGALRQAMVREEQVRHLHTGERRRRLTGELQSEQKSLDDLRRAGGGQP
jgi:flagellar biosynthesis chaperone FliJ